MEHCDGCEFGEGPCKSNDFPVCKAFENVAQKICESGYYRCADTDGEQFENCLGCFPIRKIKAIAERAEVGAPHLRLEKAEQQEERNHQARNPGGGFSPCPGAADGRERIEPEQGGGSKDGS